MEKKAKPSAPWALVVVGGRLMRYDEVSSNTARCTLLWCLISNYDIYVGSLLFSDTLFLPSSAFPWEPPVVPFLKHRLPRGSERRRRRIASGPGI